MRVFLTGATGFVGSHIIPELLARGHEVLGLTRSDAGAQKLAAAGVDAHRGDLERPETLASGAAAADAVIHCAFDHNFETFFENTRKDERNIAAMGEALAGTNKPLLITSGVGIGTPLHGGPAIEDVLNPHHANPRIATELAGAALIARRVETGGPLSAEQDELASFYGGLLAQGGAPALGAAYTRSWAAVQDRFGILPEGYDYLTGEPFAFGNALRPELADAAFNHWLLDRAPEWRMIGRTHYLNMKRFNRARYGYAQIEDMRVKPMVQSDHCPGYWWSEQMKYYYLLFSDTPRFDYARNYLSTEGNVLLGLRRA